MIVVGRKTPWLIGVIAMLVLLASISLSESYEKACVKNMRNSALFKRLRMKVHNDRSYDQKPFVIAPVVIKMIEHSDKRNENGVVSFNCTDDTCRHEKLDLDISKLEANFLPDEESLRYSVIPKAYEHFVSKKNTGSHRYKRNVSEPIVMYNINPWKKQNKITVPGHYATIKSYMKVVHPSTFSGKVDRTKRSIDDYPSRARNASDYYAQRRAVMERYHARQREINARYANRTGSISKTSNNATQLSFRHLNKDAAEKDATFRHPSVKIDPIYNGNESRNTILNESDNRRNSAPETDLGFKSDPSLSQARSSDNVERNALDYYVTPCPNVSGTFAPKTRLKHVNRTHETDNSTDHVWGTCEGKIVYQHNLLLSITGPSTVDTVFEVILEGPLCITCVKAIQFNNTRATVEKHSGGRGQGYVKLLLKGYENEGFSYIIKIWAVQKIDQNCSNVN